jgi:hypothetical protein
LAQDVLEAQRALLGLVVFISGFPLSVEILWRF